MRVLLTTVCLFFLVQTSLFAKEKEATFVEQLQQEEQALLPSCEQSVEYRELCLALREAQARAEKLSPEVIEVTEKYFDPRKKKEMMRKEIRKEVGLIAYNPQDHSFHEIMFDMPLEGNLTFQPHVRTDHFPPYQVTRLTGTSYLKMRFEIKVGEETLWALAGKHLVFEHPTREKNVRRLQELAEEKVYLAAPDYLANKEFARMGRDFALRGIEEALQELRQKSVESKAFPGELIADRIPAEVLLGFISVEQVDPCLLKERPAGCVALIPTVPFANDDQVVDAMLTQFMLSGYQAYSTICSSQGACGTAQFTNNSTYERVQDKKSGKWVRKIKAKGTYDALRERYPKAEIDPDFRRGTQSFVNSIKAQALLIDSDLALSKTPEWVRAAFISDHRVGALFPAMSYNGGPTQLENLVLLLAEYRKRHGIAEVQFDQFPWSEFAQWVKEKNQAVKKGGKLALKWETLGYLEKCVMLFRRYSAQLKARVSAP